MNSYKIAIVGCGAISRVHLDAIKQTGNNICAVCDIRPERALELSKSTGAAIYTDYEKMLDCEALDIIHICTPHFLHVPMAIDALARGINVVLEKPPAITPYQFRKLLQAEKDSTAVICTCFQNRYNSTTLFAKDLIESEQYGKLLGASGIVTWDRGGKYYTDSGWRGSYATEGGSVLINQALHTLDLLSFFLGKPTDVRSVIANMSHVEIETEDTVCAEIGYSDKKAVFYSTVSNCASPDAQITLFFENAQVELGAHDCIIREKNKPAQIHADCVLNPGKECWGSSHAIIINKFYESLTGGENPCTLDSCKDTMKLLYAIYDQDLSKAEKRILNEI